MLKIEFGENSEIRLAGRFDASQVEHAKSILGSISKSSVVDFKDLEYISSAGLGVLLMTQKRLAESGQSLKLTNMSKHIKDVFQFAGFDSIFQIE
jgi:anti-sigma B factor antagonist